MKKDIYKVLIGVLIGVIITLAVQKGLKEYENRQLLNDPSVSILNLAEQLHKRAFPGVVIKNIAVGNANKKDLERHKIKVREIKRGKPPLLIVEYEVAYDNDNNMPIVNTGIPYKVNLQYEMNSAIKEFSYIVFHDQETDQFAFLSEIALLKKDREAKILFQK